MQLRRQLHQCSNFIGLNSRFVDWMVLEVIICTLGSIVYVITLPMSLCCHDCLCFGSHSIFKALSDQESAVEMIVQPKNDDFNRDQNAERLNSLLLSCPIIAALRQLVHFGSSWTIYLAFITRLLSVHYKRLFLHSFSVLDVCHVKGAICSTELSFVHIKLVA